MEKYEKNYLITIGSNLKKERLKRKISQEKLAEIIGLHRTYIGMIERGERNISIINIIKITKTLNIEIELLLKGI